MTSHAHTLNIVGHRRYCTCIFGMKVLQNATRVIHTCMHYVFSKLWNTKQVAKCLCILHIKPLNKLHVFDKYRSLSRVLDCYKT